MQDKDVEILKAFVDNGGLDQFPDNIAVSLAKLIDLAISYQNCKGMPKELKRDLGAKKLNEEIVTESDVLEDYRRFGYNLALKELTPLFTKYKLRAEKAEQALDDIRMIVGYVYVSADIWHKGHIEHLRNCKAMCDKLICGVLMEKAVCERKPKPVLSFSERFDIVRSCKYVDVVVCQDEYSPLKNCNVIKPDILFESTSHKDCPTYKHGRTIVLPYFSEQSSTIIKRKIKDGD